MLLQPNNKVWFLKNTKECSIDLQRDLRKLSCAPILNIVHVLFVHLIKRMIYYLLMEDFLILTFNLIWKVTNNMFLNYIIYVWEISRHCQQLLGQQYSHMVFLHGWTKNRHSAEIKHVSISHHSLVKI